MCVQMSVSSVVMRSRGVVRKGHDRVGPLPRQAVCCIVFNAHGTLQLYPMAIMTN